ncbi:MAG: transporter [Ignavibacteria bacterium]|nr:transporter [Ignavibacteria bacterium]MBT8382258.1 transporter [Ignavibacteria bacterium]MBT8390931.1 transporter [Ignavibacteria bacterium]NNJ51556.1 transporter [Ignavibacteriaceae bacterium]NNL19947.1 transporter [Ignavibacteriaceae bacterium]
MQVFKTTLAGCIILFSLNSYSQSLITDRPDQTESAVTVPLNSLQIETGIAYESLKESSISIKNYSIAGTLIRYGLVDFLELRLGGAYLVTEAESTKDGPGNFFTGIKVNFISEETNSVNLALLAQAFLPLGSAAFKPEKVDPQLIIAISKSLTEKMSLSGNIGGLYSSAIEELIYRYTASLGISLANELSMFAEVYGNLTTKSAPIHNFDAGFTYLLSNDLQIDISGGKGISGIESFWFLSSGISIRLKNL